MREELLKELEKITEEEQTILDGNKEVEKQLYTTGKGFVVDRHKMLEQGKLITVRTHTRFVPFPQHSHNYIEMAYCCQGELTHVIDDNMVTLKAGDLLLLNQHSSHGILEAGFSDIGVNFVILPEFFDVAYQMLDKKSILTDFLVNILRSDSNIGQFLHFKAARVLQIQNLIENMIYSLVYHQEEGNRLIQITMGLLFLYLSKSTEILEESVPHQYREVLAETVRQYIREQYKTATLTELAVSMHQSMAGLSRTVKEFTGHTFKELLIERRFEKAAELLLSTDLSVDDVISAVGYENRSYFHRKFRQLYGMSPKNYRVSRGTAYIGGEGECQKGVNPHNL